MAGAATISAAARDASQADPPLKSPDDHTLGPGLKLRRLSLGSEIRPPNAAGRSVRNDHKAGGDWHRIMPAQREKNLLRSDHAAST